MSPSRSIDHHWLLRLLLILLMPVATSFASAQGSMRDFDVRVGKGTTMTEPVRRGIFLSKPLHYFSAASDPVAVYLEESISLSEERRGMDAIVGVGPTARVESSYDMPRLSLEAGVGVNLVSTRVIGNRQLGSNVLFSPTISAGIEVPWAGGYLGVSYMFRHLSNASMFEDNDGINFQYIVFSMRFASF
jgi:hypothetical protein